MLTELGFRSSFPLNVFPPFLAALQQSPLSLHGNQLLTTKEQRMVSPGASPGLDDEEDNEGLIITEPEDLTVRYILVSKKVSNLTFT